MGQNNDEAVGEIVGHGGVLGLRIGFPLHSIWAWEWADFSWYGNFVAFPCRNKRIIYENKKNCQSYYRRLHMAVGLCLYCDLQPFLLSSWMFLTETVSCSLAFSNSMR